MYAPLITQPIFLTTVLLICLVVFIIHFKMELLTQFPALNDEKYVYVCDIEIAHIPMYD